MVRPTSGALRAARAVSFATVSVALAAAAHVSAGGLLPGPVALGLVCVPVACVAYLLTGRRLRFPAVAAALAGLQVVLHEVLMTLSMSGSASGGCAVPGTAGHAHAGMHVACAAPGAAVGGASMGHTSVPMVTAHVAATLVTAAVLARGERALWQVWTWLCSRLGARWHVPVGAPDVPARAWPQVRSVHTVNDVGNGSINRRGPPARRWPFPLPADRAARPAEVWAGGV